MVSFALDEEKVFSWLTEIVIDYEFSRAFDEEIQSRSGVLPPPIGMDWQPIEPGREDDVYLLVRAAQDADVITSTEGMVITFEFIDDGDRGFFRWMLDVVAPTPLKLATPSEGMPMLAESDVFGVEVAVVILREAVQAANLLVQQLLEHVAARKTPGHSS
ncbi:hypothetical protein [Streptomyces sp. NPDC057253]|uniref:hypothetical protein n=1 Tax=Streptomyces sp. NPDC057253 TaxID=3346069 RepID=UPI00362892B1